MQVELGEIGAKTASILDFRHFVSNANIEKTRLWGRALGFSADLATVIPWKGQRRSGSECFLDADVRQGCRVWAG